VGKGVVARIYVTPKRAILDPQGKAIHHSLQALHYDEVSDVRAGKYLEIHLSGLARAQAEIRVREMCQKLLANLVIEDFRFEIVDE
jgi:phosphoribosylformylglycinamidine synthase